MTLPTFLIIGAMKAGTTSLWSYLERHPDVFVAPEKEINFFVAEREWPRGLEWYESRFAAAENERAVGEASPTYTMAHAFAGVPERIAGVIPEAKLVYVLRHPVERMRSHYLHRVASGKEDRPPERAFRESLDYLHTSRYAFQLEPYLDHFPREQILLIKSEDLREARLQTLRHVFGFLGVDAGFVPPGVDVEEHQTEQKRVLTRTGRRLAASPAVRRIGALAPPALRRWVARATSGTLDRARARTSDELDRRIAEGLRPDLERLQELAGPGFDAWGLV